MASDIEVYGTDWCGLTFGVREYQLSAPGWLRSSRFDIVARPPAGYTRDQLRSLLQNLLVVLLIFNVGAGPKPLEDCPLIAANGIRSSQKPPVSTIGPPKAMFDLISVSALNGMAHFWTVTARSYGWSTCSQPDPIVSSVFSPVYS